MKYPAILYALTDNRRSKIKRVVEELDRQVVAPNKSKMNMLGLTWYGVGDSSISMEMVKEWLGATEKKQTNTK